MPAIYPDETIANPLGLNVDPAEDDGAPRQQRIWSADKAMKMWNEIVALENAVFYPSYNGTGGTLPAGPVKINGFAPGTGYLVNGNFAQGVASINIDTGTAPIVIGNIFYIAGVYKNTNNGLQPFTALSNRTGAGSLSFDPPLPMAAADDAAISLNVGFKVAAAAGVPADMILSASLADKGWSRGYKTVRFLSALDTSGAAVGDPVYLHADGSMNLAVDATMKFDQIVARVETIANPGILRGAIQEPVWGKVLVSRSARAGAAFATPYTPSATRSTLVCAIVSITQAGVADDGKVTACIDPSGANTELARVEFSPQSNPGVFWVGPLVFIVPPGIAYQLNSTQVAGTPVIAIVGSIQEYLL